MKSVFITKYLSSDIVLYLLYYSVIKYLFLEFYTAIKLKQSQYYDYKCRPLDPIRRQIRIDN